MNSLITIPKYEHAKGGTKEQSPCWIDLEDVNGNKMKPNIVCNCGVCGDIGLSLIHI